MYTTGRIGAGGTLVVLVVSQVVMVVMVAIVYQPGAFQTGDNRIDFSRPGTPTDRPQGGGHVSAPTAVPLTLLSPSPNSSTSGARAFSCLFVGTQRTH